MAVNAMSLNSTLVVRYQAGTTPAGGPVLRQKSLSDVKTDATEQDIYEIASALFSLGQDPVINVFLRKNFELINLL